METTLFTQEDKALLLADPNAFRQLVLDREACWGVLAKVLPMLRSNDLELVILNAKAVSEALKPFIQAKKPFMQAKKTFMQAKKEAEEIKTPSKHRRYNPDFQKAEVKDGVTFTVCPKSVFAESAMTVSAIQHFMSRHHSRKVSTKYATNMLAIANVAIKFGSIRVNVNNKRVVEFLIFKGYIQ